MKQLANTVAPSARGDEQHDLFYLNYRNLAAVPEVPSIFTLELTTLCNNFCSGCANAQLVEAREKDSPTSHSTMANWEIILESIQPHARLVRLSGGEPTLHPEFSKIVQALEDREIPFALLTTGRWTRIKPPELIALLQPLRSFVGMLVSLHGSNETSHQAFVENHPRVFVEACANIRLATQAGIAVFTNTVLTKYSCLEVREIVTFSRELGATYTIFNRFLTHHHPLEPEPDQLKEALHVIEKLRLEGAPCRVGNNVPPCFVKTSSEGAKAGFELCHIAPNGDVRPDNLTHLTFGNILKEQLPNLWKASPAEMYRMSFAVDCLRCKAFSHCRGGAKSITFQYGLEQDHLTRQPLEVFKPAKKDKLKDSVRYLALTSD